MESNKATFEDVNRVHSGVGFDVSLDGSARENKTVRSRRRNEGKDEIKSSLVGFPLSDELLDPLVDDLILGDNLHLESGYEESTEGY